MFHRILAAVDASARAQSVFDFAVEMSRMSGAQLYVLRVVLVPPEFPPAAAGVPADPLITRMSTDAMNDLSRLMSGATADVSIHAPMVKQGVPWKVILETADECDVDLIVVGSHGYHGWDRVLGTTAGKVANIAHRNVLVVHGKDRSAKR